MTLIVLWEDRRQKGAAVVEYGPHQLLAAAVTGRLIGPDRFEHEWYRTRDRMLRDIKSIPCTASTTC